MPTVTTNLGLKKPLGNETVSRSAYNENLDILDQNVAKSSDLAAHLAESMHIPYAVASGVANAYTVTLNPVPVSYAEGMAVAVKINAENTGASTINFNSLGAKTIKKPNGNDVSAGNLKAGSIYSLRYNSTNFILQGEGGSGDAVSADVLIGKAFTNDDGEQTGTMPNNGVITITPSTSNQTIAAGYHNGSGYVVGSANLVGGNIKSGVNIFGVIGTYDPAPAHGSQSFTSSGSFTVPANVYGVFVRLWGAGGGGGYAAWYSSNYRSGGGGGGAGGFCEGFFQVTPGQGITFTVGVGGTGGTGTTGTNPIYGDNGNSGGSTTCSSLTANGGQGGVGGRAGSGTVVLGVGGTGGTASGGLTMVTGSNGFVAYNTLAPYSEYFGGQGGTAPPQDGGEGGYWRYDTEIGNIYYDAGCPGGGGGGGCSVGNHCGKDGASGKIIFIW